METRELISRCAANDRKAQRELFERFGGRLKAVAVRYVKDEDDAEDGLIDGFVKVFANIASHDTGRSFYAWARKIIVNESLNHLKSKTGACRFFDELEYCFEREPETPESLLAAKMDSAALLGAITGLPEKYRTVLNMHSFDEYTHEEISRELGIPVNTSKSILRRGRAMLMDKLNKI